MSANNTECDLRRFTLAGAKYYVRVRGLASGARFKCFVCGHWHVGRVKPWVENRQDLQDGERIRGSEF